MEPTGSTPQSILGIMWVTSVSLTERSAALRLVVCAALAAAVAWSQSADTWTIETIAGTGTGGFSGDGGAATAAQLQGPNGVAVDTQGNVYISDNQNERIRKIDAATGNISTIAGTGTSSYSGDGGPAIAAGLNAAGVAVDGSGNIYIADGINRRIRKVDASTRNISTIATTPARWGFIRDVAVDSLGNVYIANAERIHKVDTAGNIITILPIPDPDRYIPLRLVQCIAVDRSNNVYICDWNRILRVDASGNISTVAGTGAAGGDFSGDGGPATAARLNFPRDVKVDSSGNIFIADGSRIRKVDSATRNISTVAGTGQQSFGGDDGPALQAQLKDPQGMAVDNSDNVYIADWGNHRIRKMTLAPPSITPSPPNLSFTLPQGTAARSEQVVLTAGPGGANFTATSAQNWLTAQPSSGSLNAGESKTITVTANPAGLTADTYSGQLSIAVTGGVAVQVAVSLTVTPPPSITPSPPNLSFTLPQGTAARSEQVVLTAGPGGANFTATSAQNWLTAQPNSGSLNAGESKTITVTANPASLTAGAYSGQLRIAVTGGASTQVAVALTVQPPASITASPSTLSFTLPQGAAARSEQVVLTAGPGGADFTVISGQNWLTAQPNSGSLNAGESKTITVTANPAGLTAKAYSGQLLIAVSGAAPTQVAVSLTVTPPPSITPSPPTLSFTLSQGATTRSEQVVLTAGPGGANFTVTPNQGWLEATPKKAILSAGTSITLTVTAASAGLTAGPYSGQLRIAVSGGAATQVVTVSLTVTPPASITASPATLSFTLPQGAAAQSERVFLTAGPGGANFTVTVPPDQSWLTALPNSGSLDAGESETITVTANPAGLTADTYSGQLLIAVSGATATQVVTVSLTVQPPASITVSPATLSFTLPQGAAARSEQVFLTAGAGGANFTVTVPPDQSWLTALPNSGSLDAGETEPLTVTANPAGLTAGPQSGQLSIAVSGGAPTQVVTVSLNVTAAAVVWTIDTIAGTGTSGSDGDDGAATAAQLFKPYGVATYGAGNLYIADSFNHRIRKVDAAGLISTVAGSGTFGFGGDSGPARQAQFALPFSVAADSLGNLYIADTFNHRIRRVDAATGIVATVAGNGTSGFGGDDGPALQAQLARPYGVALDSSGNLYIADSDNDRIRKVDAAGLISTVAGNGTSGFGGDGRAAIQAQLDNPVGVATDSLGNLYIADGNNHRIRKVDAAGLISTAAGNGTSGFSGDDSSALQAQLAQPYGVAADGAGNLYISDWGNQRIRRVDAATRLVATIAGNGTSGFGGDDGPGTAAQLASPRGLAVDVSGNLYIADTLNNRIRRLTSSGGMPRISPGGIILGAGRPVVDRISPNAIVSVFGHDLSPPGSRKLTLDPAGLIAANLASTCLEIGGKRAPLFFVSPTQINAQVPHDLTVTAGQTTAVVVRGCGTTSERRSAAATVAVGTVSPAFFNEGDDLDGRNPIIALHGGGLGLVGSPQLGPAFTPAEPGELVTLFGTGFGATDPALEAGRIPGSAAKLVHTASFTVGGLAVPPEDVVYAGVAPTFAGLYQFAVRLPRGLPDGDATVIATVNGVSTPQGPFLSVRRR